MRTEECAQALAMWEQRCYGPGAADNATITGGHVLPPGRGGLLLQDTAPPSQLALG